MSYTAFIDRPTESDMIDCRMKPLLNELYSFRGTQITRSYILGATFSFNEKLQAFELYLPKLISLSKTYAFISCRVSDAPCVTLNSEYPSPISGVLFTKAVAYVGSSAKAVDIPLHNHHEYMKGFERTGGALEPNIYTTSSIKSWWGSTMLAIPSGDVSFRLYSDFFVPRGTGQSCLEISLTVTTVSGRSPPAETVVSLPTDD